jgi:hypothetical protein
MIPEALLNPYDHPPESDLPHPIRTMPKWTEHYFFYGYDSAEQFGMCVHIGRLPETPEVWRSVLQIYLPGEELLVLKSFGSGDRRGPHAGPLRISCVEPFRTWVVDFDGPAFVTNRTILTREVLRDGPAEVARFHMVFEAAGPLHALTTGKELTAEMSAASFHTSQVLHMRGDAEYRGRKIRLHGMGVRDHSEGPSDYGPVYGDLWFQGLFPSGKIIHIAHVAFEGFDYKSGYVFRGDGSPLETVTAIELPYVHTHGAPEKTIDVDPVAGSDRTFRIVLETTSGREVVEGELLHTHAITYLAPMEEWIGTALDRRGAVQMCEAPCRVQCNGESGFGLRERVARTEALIDRQ